MPLASIERVRCMQVTGALIREIHPELRTKGKLTAHSNDHELRYERDGETRERERMKEGGGEYRKTVFSLLFSHE